MRHRYYFDLLLNFFVLIRVYALGALWMFLILPRLKGTAWALPAYVVLGVWFAAEMAWLILTMQLRRNALKQYGS